MCLYHRRKLEELYERGDVDRRKAARRVIYWRAEEVPPAPPDDEPAAGTDADAEVETPSTVIGRADERRQGTAQRPERTTSSRRGSPAATARNAARSGGRSSSGSARPRATSRRPT